MQANAFSTQFSNRIIQILLNLREDEQVSITFLVIVVATVCEKEDFDLDTAQWLLHRFSHYLTLTSREYGSNLNVDIQTHAISIYTRDAAVGDAEIGFKIGKGTG